MAPFYTNTMTLSDLKQQIWTKASKSLTMVQVYADKAGVELPITTEAQAQAVLKAMKGKKKPPMPTLPESVKARYRAAKLAHDTVELPNVVKDGHFLEPDMPNTATANGLQEFIIQLLTWEGHFANRTGNEGRVIMRDGKPLRIPSSSKNGMQDVDTNLRHPDHPFGIPWKIEVKVGRDTHKDHQQNYGKMVQRTGAVYSVVRDAIDFLSQYEQLMKREVKNIRMFE